MLNLSSEVVYASQVLRAYLVVQDENGTPADADAAPILSLYKPDQSLHSTPAITGPDPTGTYLSDISISSSMDEGLWSVKWEYELNSISLEETGFFYVNPITIVETGSYYGSYATVDQLRHLASGIGIEDFTDDDLNYYGYVASRLIDNFCNRSFGVSTVEETKDVICDENGYWLFHVRKVPIVTINSVTVYSKTNPAASLTVPLNQLSIMKPRGIAYYPYPAFLFAQGSVLRDRDTSHLFYTINYDGGSAVPMDISIACVEIVKNMLIDQLRRSESGISQSDSSNIDSFTSGKLTVKYGKSVLSKAMTMQSSIFSPTIQALLARHVYVGQSW